MSIRLLRIEYSLYNGFHCIIMYQLMIGVGFGVRFQIWLNLEHGIWY